MKLLIQIPCLNEEENLSGVLGEIPKKIKGIHKIDVLVIDDGSLDGTFQVAKSYNVNVIRNKRNLGLGTAFKQGLEYALDNGYDILVNTDGDNQYPSRDVGRLIEPILLNEADVVIGDRQTWKIKHFSLFKKIMQKIGSGVVRKLTNSYVPDTVSGFRAYNREAMLNLNITTKFSYVLDSIMQLSKKGLVIKSIPIKTNPPTRRSRLSKNSFHHIYRSGIDILRVYVIYEPFWTFFLFSLVFSIPGFLLGARFLYFLSVGNGSGHIQSLIATAILLIWGVLFFVLGILAELLRTNRVLIEDQYKYIKRKENEKFISKK